MNFHVSITPHGRMSLPAEILQHLGVAEDGGTLLVEETSNGVILRTVAQSIAHAQALARPYAGHPQASVDAFLATRKDDSGE